MARQWEEANSRDYLFAGVGKGADIAAWKQAFRAETAVQVQNSCYLQVLLDLVKAFDRVPHHVLVREAVALGFPLWVLRLSMAAYRMPRVVRIEGVVSRIVLPLRGITAGSGLATTEMRILLIRVVDRACVMYKTITPTLFVDDLSLEGGGGEAVALREMAGFTSHVCDQFTADGLEVSRAKSVCTASSLSNGRNLERALQRHGIRFEARVKSLGVGLGGGTRRNSQASCARLKAFRARQPRFRALARAGVKVDRLVRTGGRSALMYGAAIQGVAPTMLKNQRRAAAAAAAPGGTHG